MISVHLQGKPFNNTVIQAYAPTSNAEETEIEWFSEDLQDLLELTSKRKKRCPLHYRGLGCKSRKSRDIWNSRQIWPWNAEWSRAKTNRVLPRKCTGHSKHLFQQHKGRLHMDITRWSTPKSDWLYSLQPKMEKLYTVNKNKTRTWLWLRSWTPYYQIQTEIEESRETNRPFKYDLNQIPYDYIVEVRNRFKGLDLIDRVPDELWNEVRDILQETRNKTIPMEKKWKKKNGCLRRPYK